MKRYVATAAMLWGFLLSGPLIAWPAQAAAGLAIAQLQRDTPIDFEQEILPVLKSNCLACHNRTKAKGELVLETPQTILKGGDSGAAVVPGKSAESLLLKVAAHQMEDTIMPPVGNKANARDLTTQELGLLKLWIDQGAKGEVRGLGAIEWQPLPDGLNPIYAVALTADGQWAACARANQIFVYHLPSRKLVTRLGDPQLSTDIAAARPGPAHRDLVQSLAFNFDGTLLASGSYREVKLWRRPRNVIQFQSAMSNGCVGASSPDGKWLAVGTKDGHISLFDATGQIVRDLGGSEARITCLAFSGDGSKLLSGSAGTSARIWNVATGKEIVQIPASTEINAVAWLAFDKKVALAGASPLIHIFQLPEAPEEMAMPLRHLQGHEGPVTSLAAGANGARLLSGGADGSVRLWNIENEELIQEMDQDSPVTAVAVCGDGKRFASAGLNNIAKLWNAEDGKLMAELKGDRYAQEMVAEMERSLVVATNDVIYRKNGLETLEKDHKAQLERVTRAIATNDVTEKAFAEKQKNFKDATEMTDKAEKNLAAAHDEIKRLTEAFEGADKLAKEAARRAKAAATKATQAKLLADQAAQTKADADKVAVDTAMLASKAKLARSREEAPDEAKVAADKMAREAEAVAVQAKAFAESAASDADQKQKAAAEAKSLADKAIDDVAARAFAAGQSKVPFDNISAEAPEKLKQATNTLTAATKTLAEAEKDFKRAETRRSVVSHEFELAAAAAQRSSNTVATAKTALELAKQKQKRADSDLDAARKASAEAEKLIRALTFSPDHRILATAGDDRLIHTWSAKTGAAFETFQRHVDTVLSLVFLAADTVVSVGADSAVYGWNLNPLWTLERRIGNSGDPNSPLIDRVMAVRFSPDGQYLASGGGEPSRGGEIKIWQISDGQLWKEFDNVHSDSVLSLDFSADGQLLASGAADRFARVVELPSGKVLKTFEGHTHHVTGVSWKRDGRILATGGADGVVKIWDFVTGERRKNVDGFGKEVTAIQFIGVTDQAVAASGDSLVRTLNEKGEKLREFAGAKDFVHSVAVTPDGRTVVAGGQDSVLRIWNGADGKEVASFTAPAK